MPMNRPDEKSEENRKQREKSIMGEPDRKRINRAMDVKEITHMKLR